MQAKPQYDNNKKNRVHIEQLLPKILPRHEAPLREALRIINQNISLTEATAEEIEQSPRSDYNTFLLPSPLPSPSHLVKPVNRNIFEQTPCVPVDVKLRLEKLLDACVGILSMKQSKDTDHIQYIGLTSSCHLGLLCLPIYIVRGVEYERLVRHSNWNEMQTTRMHVLVSKNDRDEWDLSHVLNKREALDYLTRASLVNRNQFAKKSLTWLTRDKQGIQTLRELKSPMDARYEFIRAIENGEKTRAIKLGRLIIKNDDAKDKENDILIKADATFFVGMQLREQKAVAANNIGYLLQHGTTNNGLKLDVDIKESIKYYEISIAWGSSAAACNLAYIYHCFYWEVEKATKLYELAIERGEREFAPRNFALLLVDKRNDSQDFIYAARCLLLSITQCESEFTKRKCIKTLNRVSKSWKFKLYASSQLKQHCSIYIK